MKPEPAIEVRGLGKSYIINHKDRASYSTLKDDFTHLITSPFEKQDNHEEKFWALKDVSFDVQPGEIFGVIGRNGSGKSTLLKILSRIVDPTEGEIKMRGRVASLLEVGTGFHPELTGRENIYFNGSMLGMSRHEISKKFNQIVEFAETEKFLDTPVKFYSSGMYVRLAFAVAAHLEPDILLLDEVLAVGDAGFQKKSLNKISTSIEEGKTVLFVSHSMPAVQQLCSKGILLKQGKLQHIGEIDEIAAEYNAIIKNEILANDDLATIWSRTKESQINDYFTLKKLFTTKDDGSVISKAVKSSDNVWVNLDVTIEKPDKNLMIGYAVYTRGKTLLFFTYTGDAPSKNKIDLSKGRTTLKGLIPHHLLNEGEYRVAVVASIHNKFWIYEPADFNNPTVNLRIDGGLSHAEYWEGPREGLLAPDIEWRQT